jgi:hypothetical protein
MRKVDQFQFIGWRRWAIFFLLLLVCAVMPQQSLAQHKKSKAPKEELSANARQARQIFDRTYQMVFGPQGSTLHYAVNIIGIYKTEGTIWYKGKKSKFVDEKYNAFNDGITYYLVERKKKTVTIYDANSDKRDKYATKFKFEPENFLYSIADSDEGFVVTLKAKKGVKGIKEIHALIDKKTRYPLSLRIKLGIISTTVKISNFKSGNISDDLFVFPRQKYQGYQIIDKRNE